MQVKIKIGFMLRGSLEYTILAWLSQLNKMGTKQSVAYHGVAHQTLQGSEFMKTYYRKSIVIYDQQPPIVSVGTK